MSKHLTPFEEAVRKMKVLSDLVVAWQEAERLGLLGPEQIRHLRRGEQALHDCKPETMAQ